MKNWVAFLLTLVLCLFVFTNENNANTSGHASASSTDRLQKECVFSAIHSSSLGSADTGSQDIIAVEQTNNTHANAAVEYNNFRFRRMQEFSFELKNILIQLSLLETLYTLEQSKSYPSDQAPKQAQSTCDYYVFALRRILI